jgi:5-methylcytosine-specific restriction endonuclease McrA
MITISPLIARSRAEAFRYDLPYYFTGKPCVRFHLAPRHRRGECVQCEIERSREWHTANPEKAKEKDRRWRAKNPDKIRAKSARRRSPENLESTKAKCRARYQISKDKMIASMRKWREANRDKAKAATEDWMARNPEKVRANVRRRRARKNGAVDHCTAEEITALRAKVGHKCAWCGKIGKTTVDHIKPLSKGGSDSIRNIQFLCRPCNSMKGAKDPIEFARYAGRLL